MASTEESSATIRSTADPMQHTIQFRDTDRLLWRKVLLYRYCQDLGSLDYLSVVQSDFNVDNEPVTIVNEQSNQLLAKIRHKSLFKTVIRISMGTSKLITLTLYYSTCLLLIQGHASPTWIDSEFHRLQACINHIQSHQNTSFEFILNDSYPTPENQPQPATQQDPIITYPLDSSIDDSLPDISLIGNLSLDNSALEVSDENSICESPNSTQENSSNLALQLQLIEDLRATIQLLKTENTDLETKLQSKDTECTNLQIENSRLKAALEESQANQVLSTNSETAPKEGQIKTINIPIKETRNNQGNITLNNRIQDNIILGDSHSRHLAEKMKNTIASVNPSRGIEQMDTSIVKNHKRVVLIAGSNNISRTDSVNVIDRKFSNIIQNIKSVNPGCKLFVQAIFPRHDINRSRKINHVNNQLKTTCDLLEATLMPAPTFSREDYTSGGLHLNEDGKTKLAKAISAHLDEDVPGPATAAPNSPFLET